MRRLMIQIAMFPVLLAGVLGALTLVWWVAVALASLAGTWAEVLVLPIFLGLLFALSAMVRAYRKGS